MLLVAARAAAVVDELELGRSDAEERDVRGERAAEGRDTSRRTRGHASIDLVRVEQHLALAGALDALRLAQVLGVLVDRERDDGVLLDVLAVVDVSGRVQM